jgi:biopolymer transport protein ExbD
MHYQDRLISAPDLANQLKALEQQKKVSVTITGDEGTPYQAIVKAMDVARSAGISSVGLSANAI